MEPIYIVVFVAVIVAALVLAFLYGFKHGFMSVDYIEYPFVFLVSQEGNTYIATSLIDDTFIGQSKDVESLIEVVRKKNPHFAQFCAISSEQVNRIELEDFEKINESV